MKQIIQLIKQNTLYCFLLIFSVGITVAFAISIWSVAVFAGGEYGPEVNKNRTVTFNHIFKINEKTNDYQTVTGIKEYKRAIKDIEMIDFYCFREERNAEARSRSENFKKENGERVGLNIFASDQNIWKEFDYTFLEGRGFNEEEVNNGENLAVISESAAFKLFGSAENVIGKEIYRETQHKKFRVIGLVKEISSLHKKAYSQVWLIPDFKKEGDFYMMDVILKEKYSKSKLALEDAINANLKKLSLELYPDGEYSYKVNQLYLWARSLKNMIIILSLLILIIPAFNSLSMVSAHLANRKAEMGIRRVYGARSTSIIFKLFKENLIISLIGMVLGFILAIFAVKIFIIPIYLSNWASSEKILPLSMFFNFKIILLAFLFCILSNLISILSPAIKLTRTALNETIKGDK